MIEFSYSSDGKLVVTGTFGYETPVKIAKVTVVGCDIGSTDSKRATKGSGSSSKSFVVNKGLKEGFTIDLDSA